MDLPRLPRPPAGKAMSQDDPSLEPSSSIQHAASARVAPPPPPPLAPLSSSRQQQNGYYALPPSSASARLYHHKTLSSTSIGRSIQLRRKRSFNNNNNSVDNKKTQDVLDRHIPGYKEKRLRQEAEAEEMKQQQQQQAVQDNFDELINSVSMSSLPRSPLAASASGCTSNGRSGTFPATTSVNTKKRLLAAGVVALTEEQLKEAQKKGRNLARLQDARLTAFTPASSVPSSVADANVYRQHHQRSMAVKRRQQQQMSMQDRYRHDFGGGDATQDAITEARIVVRHEPATSTSQSRTHSIASSSARSGSGGALLVLPLSANSLSQQSAQTPRALKPVPATAEFDSKSTALELSKLNRAIEVCNTISHSKTPRSGPVFYNNYENNNNNNNNNNDEDDFPDWSSPSGSGGGATSNPNNNNNKKRLSPMSSGGTDQSHRQKQQQQQQQTAPRYAITQPTQDWRSNLKGIPLPDREQTICSPIANRVMIRSAIQSKMEYLRDGGGAGGAFDAVVRQAKQEKKHKAVLSQESRRTTGGQHQHQHHHHHTKSTLLKQQETTDQAARLGDTIFYQQQQQKQRNDTSAIVFDRPHHHHHLSSSGDDNQDDLEFRDAIFNKTLAFRSLTHEERRQRARQKRFEQNFSHVMDNRNCAVHLPADQVLKMRWLVTLHHVVRMQRFLATIVVKKLRIERVAPTEDERRLALKLLEYEQGGYHAEMRLRAVRRIAKAMSIWALNRRVRKKREATNLIREALRVRMFLQRITSNARSFIDSVRRCQEVARRWLLVKKAQLWVMRLAWAQAEKQLMLHSAKPIVDSDEALAVYESLVSAVLRELRVCFRRAYQAQIDKVASATAQSRQAIVNSTSSPSSTPQSVSPVPGQSPSMTPSTSHLAPGGGKQQHQHPFHRMNNSNGNHKNELFYRGLDMPLFYRIRTRHQHHHHPAAPASDDKKQKNLEDGAASAMSSPAASTTTAATANKASASPGISHVPSFRDSSEAACRRAARRTCAMRHIPLVTELSTMLRKARHAMAEWQLQDHHPQQQQQQRQTSSVTGTTASPCSDSLTSPATAAAEASMAGDLSAVSFDAAAFWHVVEINHGISCPPPDLTRVPRKHHRHHHHRHHQRRETSQESDSSSSDSSSSLDSGYSNNSSSNSNNASPEYLMSLLPPYVPAPIQDSTMTPTFAPPPPSLVAMGPPLRRDPWALIWLPSALAA